MIRVGLLLYLMLATAAGPGLCCCLPDSLGNFVSKETKKKTCCPNHDQRGKHTPTKTPVAPCPCQENQLPANTILTIDRTDVFGGADDQVISPFDFLFMQPLNVNSNNIVCTSPRAHAFAHRSAQDILRAIHLLRC